MGDTKEAARLARALEAAMPAPQERRTEKMLLALLPSEKARLLAYAEDRGEPVAVAARNLILASLTMMGK